MYIEDEDDCTPENSWEPPTDPHKDDQAPCKETLEGSTHESGPPTASGV